ncbi:MAG: NAD(P)/FAD-dependent oxidoreductase, partial [Alphaproteobacteria bacterium]
MGYIDTFYRRTIADDRRFPALSGAVECDSCIIGGGLAGLTVALQLARAGQSVVLLEGQRVGWGASGRNGGFVSPGFANDGDAIARMAGAETAQELHRLSIEGARFVRDTIAELDISSAGLVHGIMSVLRHDDEPAIRKRVSYLQRVFDYQVDYMSRDRVQAVLHSKRYFQGLRDPQAFHMHPLNYLRAVAGEVERLGGRIFEDSAAIATGFSGPEKTVSTPLGKVKA